MRGIEPAGNGMPECEEGCKGGGADSLEQDREACFVSIDMWIMGCTGVDEDGLRVCAWWYGGGTLSVGIRAVLEPAEGTISALLPS